MKTISKKAKFYKLIALLCCECELQLTMSFDEGLWKFYILNHPDIIDEEEISYKGKDPNETLLLFIPKLIKLFKKNKLLRKKEFEHECSKWLGKRIKKLEWFQKFHDIL